MIEITVNSPGQEQTFAGIETPCVLGRLADASNPEMVLSDPFASRRHIELIEQDGKVVVRCIGSSAVGLASGETVEPGSEQTFDFPVELRVGRSTILVAAMNVNVSFLRPPIATMMGQSARSATDTLCLTGAADIETDRLIDWFEELIALQESAIGTQGFLSAGSQRGGRHGWT